MEMHLPKHALEVAELGLGRKYSRMPSLCRRAVIFELRVHWQISLRQNDSASKNLFMEERSGAGFPKRQQWRFTIVSIYHWAELGFQRDGNGDPPMSRYISDTALSALRNWKLFYTEWQLRNWKLFYTEWQWVNKGIQKKSLGFLVYNPREG
jgi:hypothetical protein